MPRTPPVKLKKDSSDRRIFRVVANRESNRTSVVGMMRVQRSVVVENEHSSGMRPTLLCSECKKWKSVTKEEVL